MNWKYARWKRTSSSEFDACIGKGNFLGAENDRLARRADADPSDRYFQCFFEEIDVRLGLFRQTLPLKIIDKWFFLNLVLFFDFNYWKVSYRFAFRRVAHPAWEFFVNRDNLRELLDLTWHTANLVASFTVFVGHADLHRFEIVHNVEFSNCERREVIDLICIVELH